MSAEVRHDVAKVAQLPENEGIIRNRLKVNDHFTGCFLYDAPGGKGALGASEHQN